VSINHGGNSYLNRTIRVNAPVTNSGTPEQPIIGTDSTVVTLDGTQTLTNKTLTAPTILGFNNATHTHENAVGGGTLTAAAIASGTLLEGRALVGRAPFAYAYGMNISDTYATARTLAAAGGATIFPIGLDTWMFVQSLSIRNLDAATARSWEWRLFREPDNGSATLVEVGGINGTDSFTGAGAQTRTSAATTPALVAPGMYWVVVRNSHATSSFDLGTGGSGSIAANTTRTQTGVAALTTTINPTAWTTATAWVGARLNARVFAEGAAF
jgi:hypothetical protein